MIRRRLRPVTVLAVAVALLLATGTATVVHRIHRIPLNADFAPGLEIYPVGSYGGYTEPGVYDVVTMVGFFVTKPLTLLDARPLRASPGVETISRIYFQGPGFVSPSGHPMFGGAPGAVCGRGPWPPTGYGRSFPVAGLRLAPGDPIKIGFFNRFPTAVGDYSVIGYRLRYRTSHGHVHTVTGDIVHNYISVRPAGTLEHQAGACFPEPPVYEFEPFPGYPN